jgi:flavin reductase (DIM6/NTAB) family NADH-FMN oxidoreductase RutF
LPNELTPFVDGLDYPMWVVTAADGDRRAGCLGGFWTEGSLEPSRLLVCISEVNHPHGVALGSSHLALHLLDQEQQELARLFGETTGDEVDKFEHCAWSPGPGGVPVLDDAPRHVVGQVLETVSLGDHTGFLLAPVAVRGGSLRPLTYLDAEELDPGHPVDLSSG